MRRDSPSPLLRSTAALSVALLAACGDRAPQLQVTTDARPAAPQAVGFDPPNGAFDVDPGRSSITVTFDREMDRQGWAWVIENPATAPKTGESRFDPTGRANTVDVELEPGRTYVVWVNSPEYSYFRDPNGVPATPVRWTFTTRATGAAGAASPPIAPISSRQPGPPKVVRFDPPNGASEVDASVTELRATFDRPMSEGWSWVTEGQDLFPTTTGEAYLTPDKRTAVLPVQLAAGRRYVLWLNSEQYRYFRDQAGVELPPVRWTFTTAPATP
jgi:hypothetical protein